VTARQLPPEKNAPAPAGAFFSGVSRVLARKKPPFNEFIKHLDFIKIFCGI